MTTFTISLDALHHKYAQSRGRWLDSELSKLVEDIQKIVTEGLKHGWWETDEELKERFGISRPMAQRIRTGNYDDLGRQTIFALAVIFGIPERGLWLGSDGKRRHLLEDMLPFFLDMQLLEEPVNVDAVDALIEKMGHVDWESRSDFEAFDGWLAKQDRRFPTYSAAVVRAAGLWLALRPMLQSYPDFLLRCGRMKLGPKEYQAFHSDVEIVGKMRRVAVYGKRKCSKQLNKAETAKEEAEILLEEMSTNLKHLNRNRKNSALGLLRIYKLELDDLLTLTHGELLEKSETICTVSNTFFPCNQ